jgi:hypothetical protein
LGTANGNVPVLDGDVPDLDGDIPDLVGDIPVGRCVAFSPKQRPERSGLPTPSRCSRLGFDSGRVNRKEGDEEQDKSMVRNMKLPVSASVPD